MHLRHRQMVTEIVAQAQDMYITSRAKIYIGLCEYVPSMAPCRSATELYV